MSFSSPSLFYAFFIIFLWFKTISPATHDELPQCGITGVYKTRQSVLQTPNYPDNYPPNTCLDYVVRSPYRCPTKFHIQFLDFHLESSVNCTNDYLAIGLENDGDDMDLLCGQVIGIKKYHTPDGVLRLRFFADDSPWTTAKGFKLLVTRLACERENLLRDNLDPTDDDTEVVDAPPEQLSLPNNGLPSVFRNLTLQDQYVPYLLPALFGLNNPNQLPVLPLSTNFGGNYFPVTGRPQFQQQSFQQQPINPSAEKPCTPTQGAITQFPQFYLRSNEPNQQQQQTFSADQQALLQNQVATIAPLPQSTINAQTRQQIGSPLTSPSSEPCCASGFSYKRFYLASPGFPRTAFTSLLPTQQRDCQFQLEKASQNICRLRVEFKFFDFGQTYSGTGTKQGNIEVAIGTSKDVCLEDFLEIDGERFCGCRSGYVYTTYWGLGKKYLRMRNGYSGIPSSGFLLDIYQEECNSIQFRQPQINPTLAATQNFGGVINTPNLGSTTQSTNTFTNLGQQQQQNSLNPIGFNGQQSLLGMQHQQQQQPTLLPQQIYPAYQQTIPQYSPQTNPALTQHPFWMPPQQQLPLIYPTPQFRSARNLDFVKSESAHQPVSVVETNSTRKEYHYFDGGDDVFARSRLSDEPDDPDSMVNTQLLASVRGRCNFDAMDMLRLSVDYYWITKPTCYSPQGRWFSNFLG